MTDKELEMAMISARVDDETKLGLDEFCNRAGLNTSTLLKMFAKKVVSEQRIPFTIEFDPFYSEENIAELKRRIADSKTVEHDLIEV